MFGFKEGANKGPMPGPLSCKLQILHVKLLEPKLYKK